jgi:hypothetical protein
MAWGWLCGSAFNLSFIIAICARLLVRALSWYFAAPAARLLI